MAEKHKCVAERFCDYRWSKCGKNASLCEDGKWYCGTHAPSRVLHRRAASAAKYAEEQAAWNIRAAGHDRRAVLADACPALIAALKEIMEEPSDVHACIIAREAIEEARKAGVTQ